jgi:hypothetical protein
MNGSKLPGSQRLELNVTYKFIVWEVLCQITFRLLNSYEIFDPFDLKFLRSDFGGLNWNAAVKDINLFPLHPVLELMIRF